MTAQTRAVVRGALHGAVERGWLPAFALAGRASRARRASRALPESWKAMNGGTVIVVSPHPDDETLGCGGVILRHRDGRDRVVLVQVTDGRASGAGGLSPDEMARRRAAEARVAADRFGVELVPLALPEYGWREEELVEWLRRRIAALEPDVIYAPSPVDYHPEHLKVARALAAALAAGLAGPDRPLVRVWELGVPLTATLTNLIADVAPVEPRRQAALAAYPTQVASLRGPARLRRYNRAFWGAAGAIECFWQLTPGQYRAVVAAGDWSGRRTPFRGVRPQPFGDPLCYLQGRAERRRLAQVAMAAARSVPAGRG